MQNTVGTFMHPKNQSEEIVGFRLEPGDKLQTGDRYNSSSGKWEECTCVGLTLQKTNTVWIRPAKETTPAATSGC
ncbi:MAG: hypothetical protein WCT02_02800 [Candidatus Paceibacterota bacterium]